MVRSVPRSFVGRGRSSHTAGTSVVSEGRSRSRLSSADTPGSGSPKNVAVRLCWSRNASRRSRSASANGQGVKLGMIFLGIVSPLWSPNAAQGHTRALAKQWRQTVRIETIAGPVCAHRKPLSGFVNRRSLVRMRHPAPYSSSGNKLGGPLPPVLASLKQSPASCPLGARAKASIDCSISPGSRTCRP
jgi:hypothetical protein